ncbi:MAG: hypothetical protein K1X67_07340 [Fimbriimonadaceae bacterium]|nr:hypothetical protein [Fimbriimonadaceae bacterium]
MSRVVGLGIVCVALAVVQAIAAVLTVGLVLAFLFAAVRHPRETVSFLVALGLAGLAFAKPTACIVALGTLGVIAVVLGRGRRPTQARLTVTRHESQTPPPP